jgi:hypothetical protein
MSIFLFIKGSAKSATRSASRNGVAVKNCRLLTSKSKLGGGAETKCEAPCKNEHAVSKWYNEPGSTVKAGRGYVPGALLFYNSNACKAGLGRSRGKRRSKRVRKPRR